MPIYKEDAKGEQQLIAEGFETQEKISVEQNGETFTWEERRLIVRSKHYAEAQEDSLNEHLVKAQEELGQLTQRRRGKKPLTEVNEVETAARNILKRYRVDGLLFVSVRRKVTQHTVRAYAGKAARVERDTHINIEVSRNEEAIEATRRRLGWRVYATTAPRKRFSLEKLVHVYRDQYIIERGNARLKGQPLSLNPLHLQREDHITGMVRLLSIALCALTLLEFVVREALKKVDKPLTGLYPGNPKRTTTRPSAEILLRTFRDINRVFQPSAPPFLTSLNPLQRRILKLLGFSESIYTRFGTIALTG